MNEGHSNQDWRIQLRHAMMQSFNEQELRALCFDIELDYESISTEGRTDTVIEMIDYGLRAGKILDLIRLCERQRPNMPWESISFGAKQATMNVAPVGRPIRERQQRRPREQRVESVAQPAYQLSQPQPAYPANNNAIIGWFLGGAGAIALLIAGGFILLNMLDFPPQVPPVDDGDSNNFKPPVITVVAPTSTQAVPTSTAIPPTNTPVPPTNTPIPTVAPPTATPFVGLGGSPMSAPNNAQQAAAWFPSINGLNGGGIREVKNADLYSGSTLQLMNSIGRLTSYERTYLHPNLCNSSNGFEAVYIQAFFFSNVSGAQQFMTWATDNWTYPGVVPRSDVGAQSYYYKKEPTTLSGGDCLLDIDSYTFQEQNVVYRIRVYSPVNDGRWTDSAGLSQAISLANWASGLIP